MQSILFFFIYNLRIYDLPFTVHTLQFTNLHIPKKNRIFAKSFHAFLKKQ